MGYASEMFETSKFFTEVGITRNLNLIMELFWQNEVCYTIEYIKYHSSIYGTHPIE